MKAEIITIGDELLIGQVSNNNGHWIATQFNMVGISVVQITTIPDNEEYIIKTLREASERADIIITTGGLGPTNDDLTKSAFAKYFNSPMRIFSEVYKDIETLLSSKGLEVNDLNKSQAEIPSKCTPIRNLNGTAPGMWFEKHGKIFAALPGVPYEMKPMITDYIIPKILSHFDLPQIISKTIILEGIEESTLAEILEHWEANLPDYIKLAYLPSPGLVKLRLSAVGKEEAMVYDAINEAEKKLNNIIPDCIIGYDNETIEEVVGRMLKSKMRTVSVAESCTGGYIAHRITSIPGCSNYFRGGIIAYDNQIKVNNLKVRMGIIKRYGSVSGEVVSEMVTNTRKLFKTNYSIAVTGIAGPDGGSAEKPVGTVWIAVADNHQVIAEKFQFGNNRHINIQKTATKALSMLRLLIKNSI